MQNSDPVTNSLRKRPLVRFGLLTGQILLVALGIYGLEALLLQGAHAISISISILFGLPFALGGLAAFLADPRGQSSGLSAATVSVCVVGVVLVLGAIFLREGVICFLMLAPIWFFAASFGAATLIGFRESFQKRSRLNCSLLIALPFAILFAELQFEPATQTYVVERSVKITAAPAEIWPYLLRLEDISEDEGRRNITQDLLGIPRPTQAIVIGTGEGAMRQAGWGGNVTFEEHVTDWVKDRRLVWDFIFPNDSVHTYTDRHISPEGPHLRIKTGSYELVELEDGRARLQLKTIYEATTPVNAYSSIWGQLILGDIQRNILGLIKDRVETEPVSPQ